jgi:polyhydroxyalkanoate synthesis regulator phasin
MQDAWRAYLGLALGFTEASGKRAVTVARKLVGQSGATAAQLQALAEELRSTGFANRTALTKLVRAEVDRALGRVGLATADDVAGLTARVQQLERELREARRTEQPAGAARAAAAAPGVKKAVARKAVARKAATAEVTAAPTKKALPPKPAGPERAAPAKRAAARKVPSGARTTAAKRRPSTESGKA